MGFLGKQSKATRDDEGRRLGRNYHMGALKGSSGNPFKVSV